MAQLIHSDPELFDALPTTFKELAESIPVADLIRLSEAFGGTRITVPPTFDQSHYLVERLGEDLARRLIQFSRGENICIPRCRQLRRLLTRREAWAMKAQGKSTGQIALVLKTTDRNVARMLKRERAKRDPSSR